MTGLKKQCREILLIAALAGTAFAAFCAAPPAVAQGSRKDDVVFNAQGRPMAGATVRVCASAATGQPCTPLAQIYSDPGLTQALANPTATDGLGNYTFYAAPGRYEIEVSGPTITTKQLPNVILPSDPTAPTFTTVTTTSGISAFSLSLSGNLTVSGSAAVTGALTVGGAPVPAATQENQWTASQHFKGPIPWRDVSAYMTGGSCSSTDTSNGANTTGTISLGTPKVLTLAAAKDFVNGCGLAILGAGPLPTITTPPSTLSISSVIGNGTTVTITTTANHNIPTGAAGQNEGVVVSGCTGGSGTFNGTFPIASTVDTTHLTYSASGNGTPSSCAATVTFGYAHGVGGSTTYKYQIAAVDGLMGVTAASSQFSVTSANATLNKYNYNQIFWACGNSNCYPSQTPSASPYMWLVYSDKGLGGSLSCVGTAFVNGFSDQGYNYPCPVFAPASPPGAAVAEALSTIISAGGGTTTLTLAASATTAVTNANVYHDESSFVTSCINDVINDQTIPKNQSGSSYGCYLPTGNWYLSTPSGLYTAALSPKTGDIRFRIAGSLVARTMPIFVQGGTIESIGAGGGGGNFDSGSQTQIDVGTFSGAPSPAAIVGWGGGVKLSGFAVGFPTQDAFWIDALGSSEVILKNLFTTTGGNLGSGIHIENLVGGEIDHAVLNSNAGGGQQLIDFSVSQYNGATTCCMNISNIFTQGHGIGFRSPGGNSGNCNNGLFSITNWLMENEDPLDNSMIQQDSGPNAPGTACPGVSLLYVTATNIANSDIAAQYSNFLGILGTQAEGANGNFTLSGFNGIQNLQVCVNTLTSCGAAAGGSLANVNSLQGPQSFGTFSKATDGFAQIHNYGFPQSGYANASMGPMALMDVNSVQSANNNTASLAMMMPAPSSVSVASTGAGSLAAGTYCMGFTGLDNRANSYGNGETNLSNIVCQTVGASSSITLNGYEGWRNMLFAYSDHNFYYCVVSSGSFCDPNQNLAASPSRKIAALGIGSGAPFTYVFTSTASATSAAPPANSQAMLSWLGWDYLAGPASCFFCTASHSDAWPIGFGVTPTVGLGLNLFTALGIRAGTQYQATETSVPSGVSSVDQLWADSTAHQWKKIENNGAAFSVAGTLSGTTGSIGGSALSVGQCASGTVSVSGAATTMTVSVSPNTYPGDGFIPWGYVSASGTVTVKVCAQAAGTPTSSTYNVRVIQ